VSESEEHSGNTCVGCS